MSEPNHSKTNSSKYLELKVSEWSLISFCVYSNTCKNVLKQPLTRFKSQTRANESGIGKIAEKFKFPRYYKNPSLSKIANWLRVIARWLVIFHPRVNSYRRHMRCFILCVVCCRRIARCCMLYVDCFSMYVGYCRHRADCCRLNACCAGDMVAVASSIWDVSASVWNVAAPMKIVTGTIWAVKSAMWADGE